MRPARPTAPKRVEQPCYAEQKTGVRKQRPYTASTSWRLTGPTVARLSAQDLTRWRSRPAKLRTTLLSLAVFGRQLRVKASRRPMLS
jgi:hypothetical protein